MRFQELILRARFVIVEPQTIIENGFVSISHNEIYNVGRFSSLQRHNVLDLGEAILMPGLVNAHSHTEFSLLKGAVRSKRFLEWLMECAGRQKRWTGRDWSNSVRMGLEEMAKNGITSIGDICRRTFLRNILEENPLRKAVFFEAIDSDPNSAAKTLSEIVKTISKPPPSRRFSIGLSPHAPYTVSSKLFKLVKNMRLRIAIHTAETREELKFLQSGTGDFATLLNIVGKPLPFDTPPSCTPIQYLKRLGVLGEKTNLIHCNFITNDDIKEIAKARSPVIFCPGSFDYFRHADWKEYKLKALLKNGVNVALGTDSLASNSDLSIFREMALVRKHYDISPRRIFEMATTSGIKALFGNAKIGVLKKGYMADCIAIKAKGVSKKNILEFITSGGSKVISSVVNGVNLPLPC
ncbi:amidohydrolase family protein [Candidatus Peregrinibacteria bacterium]|nr:amidohydrolase family protein [Candidatus Peregrinibacteria bacterium]